MGGVVPPRRDGGFVLVSVLLALALLSAIAIALSYHARSMARTAYADTTAAAAQARVDGIVRLIAFRLGDRTFAGQWRRNAEPFACRLDTDVLLVEVIDAGGLVDLNAAPASLLAALLRGVGGDRERSEGLAAAIVTFRGASSPDEAERTIAAYAAAGLGHGPKLMPFETVAELDQVLGLAPKLVASLRPFVTVQSRLPGLDPLVAPRRLLGTLGIAPGTTPGGETLPQALQIRSPGRAFVVRARLQGVGASTARREATVELASASATGTLMRDWSRGSDRASDAIAITPSNIEQDCRALFAATPAR